MTDSTQIIRTNALELRTHIAHCLEFIHSRRLRSDDAQTFGKIREKARWAGENIERELQKLEDNDA